MSILKKCWNPDTRCLWMWPHLKIGSSCFNQVKKGSYWLMVSTNSMIIVLIRGKFEHRQPQNKIMWRHSHTAEKSCEDRHKHESLQIYNARNTKHCQQTVGTRGEARNSFSLKTYRISQLFRHLDFGLLVFRTVRGYFLLF